MSSNWATDIQTLVYELKLITQYKKVLDSDDSDTLQSVDESTDFPLVCLSFSGNSLVRNSYGQYIEGSSYIDFSLSDKISSYADANTAKRYIRDLLAYAMAKISLCGYIIDSSRISYNEGLIGGTKVISASFTITT